ncbi:MAG: FmdE family protein [Candidatus Bathyarchaeia archaeon]
MRDIIKLAESFHGHLSPGVALGIRMSQIGLEKLGLSRGDKRLFAVVETTLCLADGVQACTGCTVGHGSLRVEDFGKLAICLARSDTKKGVRLTLKQESLPRNVNDWVMRRRKFSHSEEDEISKEMLCLDESHFKIEEVAIEPFSEFSEVGIVQCDICGEWVVEDKTVRAKGKILCRSCFGACYYTPCNPHSIKCDIGGCL